VGKIDQLETQYAPLIAVAVKDGETCMACFVFMA
jgi:hypothetical protein